MRRFSFDTLFQAKECDLERLLNWLKPDWRDDLPSKYHRGYKFELCILIIREEKKY